MVLEFWPYGMERAGSYDALKSAVLSAGYRKFHDLGDEQAGACAVTGDALDQLYKRLAARQTFTDILLVR